MKKTIIWSVIGVLGLVIAVLLYNVLSKEFKPDEVKLTTPPTENTEASKDQEKPDNKESSENNESKPTGDYRDFSVYTYDGKETKLSEVIAEGKPTIVNFWTTWCGYCKQEMPDFNEVYKEYSDRVNFMMVDVNGEGNDNRDEAKAYVSEAGFEFPVYYDDQLSATYAYGIGSFPTTVVIDRNGYTRYANPGMMSKETLVSIIETIIK